MTNFRKLATGQGDAGATMKFNITRPELCNLFRVPCMDTRARMHQRLDQVLNYLDEIDRRKPRGQIVGTISLPRRITP